ncbi:hypothetical protein D4764_0292100, partial [Takifugu flavidus]
SFLERTTVEQWESFVLGRPDDATTILVAELILEIIANLSNSVVTTLKSHTRTSEERVLTKLEETLPQVLSEALGIQDEVDSDGLQTLTDTIQKEVRANLNSSRASSEKGTPNQRITPTSRINVMIVQLVELFKKFSDKIRTFIGPRPHKTNVDRIPSSREGFLLKDNISPMAEGIRNEMDYAFQDVFRPLMVDLPGDECKELQHEISDEIGIVAEELSIFSDKSPETLAAEAKSESVETILEKLSTQFLDQEDDKAEREDALVQVFTDLSGNKVLDFNQELSNEIYRHSVPEAAPPSVEREVQSEVQADIRSKSWVFVALMNWYVKTQVNWVIDRVMVPFGGKSEVNLVPEQVTYDEGQRAKNKSYVMYIIEKVVNAVRLDARMLPLTLHEFVNNLSEIVWEKVKDEQFYTDSDVFKNLEKNIKKLLYKVLGCPEKSFLERTTVEQWESFVLGRPDDATTILVAELILEIIANLSNSVVTTLKSHTRTSEERVLTKLEETLPQVLSEALGIQDEVDSDGLQTLTDTIQKEVRANLNSSRASSEKGTPNQRITPTSRINVMIVQLVELFKKFSDKIRTFIGPRPRKTNVDRIPSSREGFLLKDNISPMAEGIRNEMDYAFQDVFRPLMVDLPGDECKELQHEISDEIGIVAEELSIFSDKSPETLAAEAKSESVETILEKLSTQFLDQEDDKAEREDALVQVFTDLSGNKVLDFNQELSNEIYRHSVPEAAPPSVEREVQSEVQADIRSKSWVFVALMNWYVKTQVKWVIDRVMVPFGGKSEVNLVPEQVTYDEGQRAKNKSYVMYIIEKVVNAVRLDARMLPLTLHEFVNNLSEIVWEKVKDEQFYTDSDVFKNLEKNIKKLLYKVLGCPEK